MIVLAVLLTGMLLGALPASAHPTLLVTDPAADTAVADSPPAITLVFNEAITIGPTALTLLDAGNRSLPLGVAHLAQGGHLLAAALPITLGPGVYVVRWRATGSDGDLVEEQFPFGVGAAMLGPGSGNTPSISWPDTALRWLLFGGIAVSGGSLVGRRFTASARRMKPALVTIRSWVLPGAVLAVLGVVGLAVTLILGTGSAAALWQGRAGRLLIVEGLALLVAVTLALIRKPAWTSAPLLIVVAAEGVRSHANVADPGWGAVLTGIHLAAAAIWVGTLLYVTRAVFAWRTDGAAVKWVMAGYARLAIWVFVVVITTGTVSALLLVPLSTVFSTSYGRVLLIKLALVAAAAAVEAGCDRIFQDKVSSRVKDRAGLLAALDYLRAGDTLCVWKLDRLGRSVKDVLTIADDLHSRGVGLRILTGRLAGTYTPTGEGRFFFTMMAAFAELERDMLQERTFAGLAAAREQGRIGGRPTVMNPDTLAVARARQANGETPTQIAKALGISRATVYRHLNSE